MQLRIARWNIHRCIGRDGVLSRERCAAVLQELDADVVALQEVESRPGHPHDVPAFPARETGSQAIVGATMMRDDTHYGNTLLTRLSPPAARHHDISVPGREPRAALDVGFATGNCRVQLVATHLGLRPAERRIQVQQLVPVLNVDNRDLVVLLGDLNEWFLRGRPLRLLRRVFPDSPHLAAGRRGRRCYRSIVSGYIHAGPWYVCRHSAAH